MNRRRMIVAAGSLSLAGCLRLQDDANGDTEAGNGGNEGSLLSSQEEAIATAAGLATDDALELNQFDGDGPDGIVFSESAGGGSSSSGPEDGLYAASDINIESADQADTIAFGGATDRTLQVADLTTGTTATFRPEPGVDRVDADRININTRGDGELREETPTFYDHDREEAATYLPGTWEGDTEMFGTYPFGEYVVTLHEGESPIAATDGGTHGIGYQFQFDQTETSAFVTRHASVDERWEPVLHVDDDEELVGSHRPDEQVLAFDLEVLSVPAGRYDWSVELREPGAEFPYREYISLSGSLADPLLIQ